MKAKRLMILGFDGAMPEHLEKFVAEGVMPNVAELMNSGAYARALPCPPVDTPTNWTTMVTGAWPGPPGLTSSSGATSVSAITDCRQPNSPRPGHPGTSPGIPPRRRGLRPGRRPTGVS